MRYIVYGAGAIGGVIGAKLHQTGRDVVLIARGDHLRAIAESGLTLQTPDEVVAVRPTLVAGPEAIVFREGVVVLLAVKSQDTVTALETLRRTAGGTVPVVCAQNGFENERSALRRFKNVYGMLVWMSASHLTPGVVQAASSPIHGWLDLGCYPSGSDDVAARIAADLSSAGFLSTATPDIMPWKYAKLLGNLGNALAALCGLEADVRDLAGLVRAEGTAVYRAAGITWTADAEFVARHARVSRPRAVSGPRWLGGSTWQSFERGTGASETDYLNGEIVLLGRLHGVPTPVNGLVQRLTTRAAAERSSPGSMAPDAVRAMLS